MRITLKPILPRSLFGRAALILIAPIVAIQLVVSLNFVQRHYEGVTRQLTEGTVIGLRHLIMETDRMPDLVAAQGRLAALAADLAFRAELPARESPPAQDLRSGWDWSGRVVIKELRKALPQVRVVDLVTADGEAKIWLEGRHGLVWLLLDRRRVSATNPHQLLVLMVGVSVLITLISSVFLRQELRPITKLARAAEAFGKGQSLAYRPKGATEVRAAGNAFLDMRHRIERQIEQRTLLLSGVSHDLRTPLTRLKLGLAFLPEDAEQAAMLQDVAQMERLVEEFLSFARGDAMEPSEVADPVALVRRVVENAVRSGQAVAMGRIEGGVDVRMRSQAIERALENLIGNAVRHGTRAEVGLVIGDRLARFLVEDDGPGIPKELRAQALAPFARLDAARDPNRGGGVGLGLSIAADVARSHGGDLRLGQSTSLGGLRAEFYIAR